jgi:hypothetical protein
VLPEWLSTWLPNTRQEGWNSVLPGRYQIFVDIVIHRGESEAVESVTMPNLAETGEGKAEGKRAEPPTTNDLSSSTGHPPLSL